MENPPMQVTCTELWFLLQELLDETLGAHTCGVRGGGHWGGGLVAFGPQDWAGQRPSGRSSPYKAHSPKLAPQVRCGIHGLAQPEPDTLCLSQGKKKKTSSWEKLPTVLLKNAAARLKSATAVLARVFSNRCRWGGFTLVSDGQFDQKTLEHVYI